MVRRLQESHLSKGLIERVLATKEKVDQTVEALKEWIEDELNGWFALLQGWMIARV